jgi:hypothetical protein
MDAHRQYYMPLVCIYTHSNIQACSMNSLFRQTCVCNINMGTYSCMHTRRHYACIYTYIHTYVHKYVHTYVTPWLLVREGPIPTERSPLTGEVSTNCCRWRSVVWLMRRILGSLDRSRYYFFQVVPQLESRGWVDPVPDPYCSENLVAPGIEPGPLATRAQRRSHTWIITCIHTYIHTIHLLHKRTWRCSSRWLDSSK